MASSKVKIGILGSRFQAECIAGAVKAMPEESEVVAVASPTKGHAAGFAKRHGIPRAYTDYRELLRDPDGEMISITAPNRLHAQITKQSGGGAVMDLGCHGIAFCWWFLGKPKIKSVYSQMATAGAPSAHAGRRRSGHDHRIRERRRRDGRVQ